MSLNNRIERLKRRIDELDAGTNVKFFNSHQEYDEAFKNGSIKKNDVCFIDDIPDED